MLSPRELALYSHVLDEAVGQEGEGHHYPHEEYAARFKKIKNKSRDELLDEQLKVTSAILPPC